MPLRKQGALNAGSARLARSEVGPHHNHPTTSERAASAEDAYKEPLTAGKILPHKAEDHGDHPANRSSNEAHQFGNWAN